jgi:hypothetical protein
VARRDNQNRTAFTLLEVLITAVLLATLMTGIWGIYRMFSALYETGYVKTERAQLVRSLMQQFSEDLASTIMPPTVPKGRKGRSVASSTFATVSSANRSSDAPSCATRIGLLGTYNSLQLDVVQIEPPTLAAPPPTEAYGLPDQDLAEKTGEIVTVFYRFEPPASSELDALSSLSSADGEQERQPGLTREEYRLNRLPVVDPRASEVFPRPMTVQDSALPDFPDAGLRLPESPGEVPGEAEFSRTETIHLPEVVGLEFRYFDGRQWTDAWDSRSRRALPLAVEVSVEIEFAGDEEKTTSSESQEWEPETATVEDQQEVLTEPGEPPLVEGTVAADLPPSYRFVLHLPQGVEKKGSRSRPRSAEFDEPEDDFRSDAADPFASDDDEEFYREQQFRDEGR